MKEYPFPCYEYAFNKPVIFMFPMIRPNTIGVYYGVEEQEKIAAVILKEPGLEKTVFKSEDFDGYMTLVYPQIDPNYFTIVQKSSIGVLDLKNGKQIIDYQPKLPNYEVENEYIAGRLISVSGRVCISLHRPYISPDGEIILCYSLVMEDIQNGQVCKRLRVNQHSTGKIFFGSRYIYFSECIKENKKLLFVWRAVDDSLNFVDHPLIPILNKQYETYRSDAILVSESQECAIARGSLNTDSTGKSFFQITPWAKNHPPVPILLPDNQRPSQYISKETFLLSPSGKWLFFVAAKPGLPTQGPEHYYLMYIDKTLPNYYLPPIKIETGGDDFKVTWMQEPEGFVLWDGKHLRYWDLSKFDPGKFSRIIK